MEQARIDEEEAAIEAAEQQMEAARLARELAANAGQPAEPLGEEQVRLDVEEEAIRWLCWHSRRHLQSRAQQWSRPG